MFRAGRTLALGCLLILQPLLAQAGGNSLLIPATSRYALNTVPEELQQTLAACQQIANGGGAEAQYKLGEFFYDGKRIPCDLQTTLNQFGKASLQDHAQTQYHLSTMFFRDGEAPASSVQAYIVLKMATVNGTEDALDGADLVAEQMNRDELGIAARVPGQIFRNYLVELWTAGDVIPFTSLP